MKVRVSIDNVSYERKPEKQEIVGAKRRACDNWQEMELETIADLVGNQGHAFIPAHLVGGIKAENCIGMQLFALDFDGGVSFEQIRGKCDGLGLPIAFAYHTFSSTQEYEKFRIVFVHETLIKDKGDIQRLYQNRSEYSQYIVRQVKVVINVSFHYAVKNRLIVANPAEGINLPKTVEARPYHTRNIDTAKTLDMEQIQKLLEASRGTPIHMQVLFNVLMGLRRQEINAVKYSDVDYINQTLSVERQLGRKLDRTPNSTGRKVSTKTELQLKTFSSRRVLPIPDYVFEAILQERETYEKNRKRRGEAFQDSDYICCSGYGNPRSKDFHWRYYKKLLKDTGLPDIRWHDLRSSYCTMLLKSEFNPKAVSKLMGHAKEIITMDVYGDNANIIPEELPELEAYMEKVMPKKAEEEEAAEDISDILIDVDKYLYDGESEKQ
ncbi:MAG: site-specific integrase [Lachnospiraceae bacterium]|nr:site-specific integrase [Lachnospiraceae bacterium]